MTTTNAQQHDIDEHSNRRAAIAYLFAGIRARVARFARSCASFGLATARLDQERRPAVMISAHDVARELRQRVPNVDSLKLQKLLYYCQGWHLSHYGEPMFEERIEAWDHGPVVAEQWADEKHGRLRRLPVGIPSASHLDVIDHVVETYGRSSGLQLRDQTHSEPPWRNNYDRDRARSRGSRTIPLDALAEFFRSEEDRTSSRPREPWVPVLEPTPPTCEQLEQLASLERGG